MGYKVLFESGIFLPESGVLSKCSSQAKLSVGFIGAVADDVDVDVRHGVILGDRTEVERSVRSRSPRRV